MFVYLQIAYRFIMATIKFATDFFQKLVDAFKIQQKYSRPIITKNLKHRNRVGELILSDFKI